jgi:hypothetical protein
MHERRLSCIRIPHKRDTKVIATRERPVQSAARLRFAGRGRNQAPQPVTADLHCRIPRRPYDRSNARITRQEESGRAHGQFAELEVRIERIVRRLDIHEQLKRSYPARAIRERRRARRICPPTSSPLRTPPQRVIVRATGSSPPTGPPVRDERQPSMRFRCHRVQSGHGRDIRLEVPALPFDAERGSMPIIWRSWLCPRSSFNM